MTGTRPAEILRQLEQTGGTDGELLGRFAATKDGSAFAELVRRHGPLVLGVCRRVTGHAQDAEDAFQAAFLILARKAGAIRDPGLLGNWLYGVAFRVAWRAKRSAGRRRAREVSVSTLPDSPALPPPPTSELAPILDEVLAQLSACYRDAIILCDLRGLPRAEAAQALGIPEGTLSSRLANGRKKLAARLAKRGVSLSIAALPAVVGEMPALAAVPNELIAKTCGLVADWAAGGAVPGPLARLAEGGLTVRKVFMLVSTMAVAVTGAVFAARPGPELPTDPPKPPVVAQKPEPAPQPKAEPKPGDKSVTAFTSPRRQGVLDLDGIGPADARWNLSGTHLGVLGARRVQPPGRTEPNVWLLEPKADSTQYVVEPTGEVGLVGVTRKGAGIIRGVGIITELREYHLISGRHQLTLWTEIERRPRPKNTSELMEALTVELDLPETRGYALTWDMKTFRTVALVRDSVGAVTKLEVLEVDANTGKANKSLLKAESGEFALSDNGKRLAVLNRDATKVTVYDVDRGEKLFEYSFPTSPPGKVPLISREPFLVFSPDGRKLAVSRGFDRVDLLSADTGKHAAELEGTADAALLLRPSAFTGDGSLFAAVGRGYKRVERNTPDHWAFERSFLTVWDTQTGRAVKTWNRETDNVTSVRAVFNPVRALLAILEPNGENAIRVGFWDFAAEVEKK